MECREFQVSYTDLTGGTLSRAEAAQAEAHRGLCADCQAWLREQQLLRSLLRNRLPVYQAPVSLKRQIRATIGSRGRTWWPQAMTAALATALAMVLLFLPALPSRAPGEGLQSFLPAILDEHIRSVLRNKVLAGDEEIAEAFFQLQSETGVQSSLFYTGDDETRLMKAQPTYLRNLQGIALFYEEVEGHKVTYLLLRNGQGRFRPPDIGRVQIDRFRPYLVRTDGFALLTWRFGEWSMFLISDMVSDHDLAKFERIFLRFRTAAESTLY